MAWFQIWRVRRIARTVSRHNRDVIDARFEGIRVGKFRNGREVKS